MGFVIFSDKQGCGYIEESKESLNISKIPVNICGQSINPGDKTNLSGYLSRDIEYMGIKDDNEMIFYLGSIGDLFSTAHYFQAIFRITETRIFEMFSHISGRDFYFIKGEWK